MCTGHYKVQREVLEEPHSWSVYLAGELVASGVTSPALSLEERPSTLPNVTLRRSLLLTRAVINTVPLWEGHGYCSQNGRQPDNAPYRQAAQVRLA